MQNSTCVHVCLCECECVNSAYMCVCEFTYVPSFMHMRVSPCLQSFICIWVPQRTWARGASLRFHMGKSLLLQLQNLGMSEAEDTMEKWKNILDSKKSHWSELLKYKCSIHQEESLLVTPINLNISSREKLLE